VQTGACQLKNQDIVPNLNGLHIKRGELKTVQVNLGNRCNQACRHCHIEASPKGTRIMDQETAVKIIKKLAELPIRKVEFTGGTPEMIPAFKLFVEKLSGAGKALTVRTSLTVLQNPKYSFYIDLYKEHKVRIIASLPGTFDDVTDQQRGKGVFKRSIGLLKRLNELGFGTNGLDLDLVFNPLETELPPPQAEIERIFRQILKERYSIQFNNLYTIVNSPIGRFKKALEAKGLLEDYLNTLKANFNPATIGSIMCKELISVDYQGCVYDCDFNLALGLPVKGYERKKFWEIDFSDFSPKITTGEHCYACTAGRGSSCMGEIAMESKIRDDVKNYYGRELQTSKDLKTTACCPADALPEYVRDVLPYIVDEVKEKFYGCGSPIPPAIEGCTVLDLGCGTGRDSFIAAKLVGQRGRVIGLDMTDEQLAVANRNVEAQMERFGYDRPNVEFKKGYIEDLKGAGIEDGSIDVVISNCVINLSPDKEAVFSEIFRVLKPGGELYFSDVFSGRRVPGHLKHDPVLLGECLAGAMYIEDFRRMLLRLGCLDYRVISKRKIDLKNPEIEEKIGMVDFYSMTVRAFKLDDLEDICEDYGQVAVYLGTVPRFPHHLELDDHHRFITGKPMLVCGNTASMLSNTRFAPHFKVMGDRSVHYGPFDCASPASIEGEEPSADTCSCS